MIRKYHNHKLQTAPWYREEKPLNHHETPGRQIKQSNQLSLPHQHDCNTRMDINSVQQNTEQPQTPTTGATTNKKSTTTEPPPQNGQQPKPPGGPNALHWHQILTPDSAAIEAQETLSTHGLDINLDKSTVTYVGIADWNYFLECLKAIEKPQRFKVALIYLMKYFQETELCDFFFVLLNL